MKFGTFVPITPKPKILALALALCVISPPAIGKASEHQVSKAIEHAKDATVGILQHEEGLPRSQATKNYFSVRGTGVHIRDGYILTARHAVQKTQTRNPGTWNNITVITEDLQEMPAVLTGVNAFMDIAVYRVTHQEGISMLNSITFSAWPLDMEKKILLSVTP